MESMHDLEVLLETGRRLIILQTEREGCFIEGFRRIAKRSSKAYFQWTITQGLERLAVNFEAQSLSRDVAQLFGQINSTERESVYVLVDFHHYLDDPIVIRQIKDVLLHSSHTLILLSQSIELPAELQPQATRYELPLPTVHQLNKMVNDLAVEWLAEQGESLKVSDKGIVQQLLKGLCGLSYSDAMRMARHAIWNDGIIDQSDLNEVATHKFELLNTNNVLSLDIDSEELSDIAGFAKLKDWLEVRRKIFTGEHKLPGGDRPKGMLLLGVQGCGKSIAAKAVAGSWQLPLLHLDFGTLYNRFYGQTEENLRSALAVAEKMQPCVLWLDEIEKGLSAVSSNDDVSKRLLGTFLTWLSEKKESVFVVATANDVSALPPELMRKGRFDEVFFVDLPDVHERAKILGIHLKRRKQSSKNLNLEEIAQVTDGFSGAELEQLVVSAMYHSYGNDRATSLDTALLLQMVSETRPLSVLMAEKIQQLRDWAKGRAVSVS